jgi:predicted ester cyclase
MKDTRTLVEEWLVAGDAGQLDVFDELLHADVRVHAPLGLSTTGIEEEKEVWRAALRAMPDLRHEVQDVVVGHATVAVRTVVTGTLVGAFGGIEATGHPFRIDQAVFALARDGKLAEIWEIADVSAVTRTAGEAP